MAKAAKRGLSGLRLALQPSLLPRRSVYVIAGDDPFLSQEAWRIVRSQAVGDEDEGLAVSRYAGDTAELRDVLDELSTPTFFGGNRVVLVDDADKFVSTYRQQLEGALARERKRGVLVLRCRTWRSDTRLAAVVARVGCTIDCRAPKYQEARSWLTNWARQKHGKELSADARDLLLEYIGLDLGRLDQELEKLALYVGQRHEITAEDVDQVVTHGRARTAWELAEAAANGKLSAALEILDRLLTAGETPLAVFYAVAWQFRRLARVARLILSGMSTKEALSAARVPPFQRDAVVGQLRRIGRVRLLRMYDLILETDLALKSTDIDPRVALEQFITAVACDQDEISTARWLRPLVRM